MAGVVRRGKIVAVVHVVLDRPDADNAIDPALRDELPAALDAAEWEGARCIVPRGGDTVLEHRPARFGGS